MRNCAVSALPLVSLVPPVYLKGVFGVTCLSLACVLQRFLQKSTQVVGDCIAPEGSRDQHLGMG